MGTPKSGSGRSARRDGLGCEVSRRKSESTGPATLRQAKKKRPEAELGGPLVTKSTRDGRCRARGVHGRTPTETSRQGSSLPFGHTSRTAAAKTAKRVTAATALPYRRRHGVAERRESSPNYRSQGQRGDNHMSIKIRAITAVVAACTTATAFSALTASSASAHGSGDGPGALAEGAQQQASSRRSGWPSLARTSGTPTDSSAPSTRSRRERHGRHDRTAVRGRRHRRHPGRRTFAFTSSNDDHSSTSLTIRSKGRPDVVADLSGYEKKANPDKRATYGVVSGGRPAHRASSMPSS